MSITIQCTEHPDYDGETKPEYGRCVACRSLRAFILDLAPADVAGLVQDALAFGDLRAVELADQPAPTTPPGEDDPDEL